MTSVIFIINNKSLKFYLYGETWVLVFTGQLAISSSPKCSFAGALRRERNVVINILPPHHQEIRILVILCDGLVGNLNDLSCHLPDLMRETSLSCGMDICRERGH